MKLVSAANLPPILSTQVGKPSPLWYPGHMITAHAERSSRPHPTEGFPPQPHNQPPHQQRTPIVPLQGIALQGHAPSLFTPTSLRHARCGPAPSQPPLPPPIPPLDRPPCHTPRQSSCHKTFQHSRRAQTSKSPKPPLSALDRPPTLLPSCPLGVNTPPRPLVYPGTHL